MRKSLFGFLLCLLLLSGSACMISEQVGQDQEDLTFHFDTGFNRAMLFGRTGVLAVVALWLFAGSKKSPGSAVLGVVFLAGAGYLLVKGYPTLSRYRVQVLGDGLTIAIPPEPDKVLAWGTIEEMYIEGMGPATDSPRTSSSGGSPSRTGIR